MATEKRLIDANHIVAVAEHAYNEWNLAMAAADGQRQINQVYKMEELCKAVKAVADAAPTVDAVEVVRCRDCKHYMEHPRTKRMCCYVHLLTPHHMRNDDFCSYGERKHNGQ